MKNLRWFVTLAVALIVIGSAARVPVLQRIDAFAEQHRGPLVATAVGLMILGVLAWLGGVVYNSLKSGRPLTPQEGPERGAYMVGATLRDRFWGKTWGKGFDDEFSFAAAKRALKDGMWWKDPRWRIRFLISAGVLATGIGLFALVGMLTPVGIKLLLAGAMLYLLVRLAWAFRGA